MKRSIISFCIFATLVITGVCFEIIYSNSFVNETLEITKKVQEGQDAQIYGKYLESNNLLNRLFFKRSTIEKFEKEFCELLAYDRNSDDFEASTKRIKLYCEKIKNAGIY